MKKYSDVCSVSSELFFKFGILDAYIDLDSNLHVDPSLLKDCTITEFKGAYEEFLAYFTKVLHLVPYANNSDSRFYKEIVRLLTFKERSNTGLGYSKGSNDGNGIGGKLSVQLTNAAVEIAQVGINDPVIFELMPFIEENIALDRISDMTIDILYERFLQFTARVAQEMEVKTKKIKILGKEYMLPANMGKPIIFMPLSILCDIPIAKNWDDVDSVQSYSNMLRKRISMAIGLSWKEASQLKKSEIKKHLVDDPELFKSVIKSWKQKIPIPYDINNDKQCEVLCDSWAKEWVGKFPMSLNASSNNIYEIALAICDQFKNLMECHALYECIMNPDGSYKPERASQLLFYAIADTYCKANNIDLSREVNSGLGALDFKLSWGYIARVCIELKYSSNDVVAGYTKHLPVYCAAEKTDKSIFLVLRNSNSDDLKMERLQKLASENTSSTVIIVDVRKQKSASKR